MGWRRWYVLTICNPSKGSRTMPQKSSVRVNDVAVTTVTWT